MATKKVNVPLLGAVSPLLLGGVLFLLVMIAGKIKALFNSFFVTEEEHKEALQETETEMKKAEKSINKGLLTKKESFYVQLAEFLYNQMQHSGSGDVSGMLEKLTPLNADELDYVWTKFGVRKNLVFGIGQLEGDLFAWFDAELSDSNPLTWNALSKMKAIWKKTGRWA